MALSINDFLPMLPPNPPLPSFLMRRLTKAKLAGFNLQIIDEKQATTTRQSTGQAGRDFQFYPIINLTPDVNGSFSITWKYVNTFNGNVYDSGPITNVFPGLTGGTAVNLKLVDNRPTGEGPGQRDPERNGAIAIGDKDFAGLGLQDGLWHSFKSVVTGTVTSPSGATASFSGQLGPENFKSVGALSVTMQPFQLTVIT